MRKIGTILSPECKTYANDIQQLCNVPEYINLQYLRLIESLVCQRISEKVLDNKKSNLENEPVTVEIPLIGNLTITPQLWHHNHLKTGKPSIHYEFSFEPLPAFKNHVSNIYSNNECKLVSLLSENYAEILKQAYEDLL